MESRRLLDDVRVIDLSQYIPGPFATRQLADLGADVIKIEPPGGDPMRRFMRRDRDEISAIYRHVNRGKRVCRIDLKTDAGRAILRELLAGADILLESYRPGVLERLGFGRDALAEINPRLIHCALSGFGQTGPWAQRAGHDINYCALAGQSIASGTVDAPVMSYPPIADHASALQAAVAILAALHARAQNGTGAYLDLSITESILAWQYLSAIVGTGERAASILNGGAACYNIYRCADNRFVSIGAIEAEFWEYFCNAIGRPDWVARQLEPMPQTELIAEVADLFAGEPRGYWHELLDPVDCCYAPLLEPEELAINPQFAARDAWPDSIPNYAGWIDDAALKIKTDIVELDVGQPPDWNTAR